MNSPSTVAPSQPVARSPLTQKEAGALVDHAERVLAPTYARPPRVFVSGEGSILVDVEGRRYLDMTSGVAVNALGHGSPVIANALREASEGLIHTSNLFHTLPAADLAERLVERSFADRVFFCNSGTESVEAALKFALLKGEPFRKKVVAFRGSFHGRSLGSLCVTDMPGHHKTFGRALFRVFAPFNSDDALTAIDAFTCAVIVEPIQGEGGVREADGAWLKALRMRCTQLNVPLIFDEVQTGLGRTGKLWAHEWSEITPDMMTLAKPLAGGLPMGAVLMTEEVASYLHPGQHATTFGGGPLVATVAARVFDEISNPEFLAEVRAKAKFLRERLSELASPYVGELRGRGLLLGVQLRMPEHVSLPAKRVVSAALDEGLLLVAARDQVVRFLPALTVTRDDLALAVERFQAALDQVVNT